MIKFLNLEQMNARYKADLEEAAKRVINSGWYLNGVELESFERNYADFCGVNHCIGVSNGLDALRLIFRAYIELGIMQTGDEVIVPANTFIASVLAITDSGLVPIFVEPNEDTFNLDTDCLSKVITNKTKAVLAVHLYGQISIDGTLLKYCKENGLKLIEDAAQSHGAKWQGKRSGGLGDAAAHSFYPGKNLGALGDSGAVTTCDALLCKTVKSLRNYGSEIRYINNYQGLNCRMDEIQAAFLNVKLAHLKEDIAKRRDIADFYLENIKNKSVKLPKVQDVEAHVWHLFVVRCINRDEIQNYLSENQIETVIHYPIPPYKQLAYREYQDLSFPITERLSREILSLPIDPTLSIEDLNQIVELLNKF